MFTDTRYLGDRVPVRVRKQNFYRIVVSSMSFFRYFCVLRTPFSFGRQRHRSHRAKHSECSYGNNYLRCLRNKEIARISRFDVGQHMCVLLFMYSRVIPDRISRRKHISNGKTPSGRRPRRPRTDHMSRDANGPGKQLCTARNILL